MHHCLKVLQIAQSDLLCFVWFHDMQHLCWHSAMQRVHFQEMHRGVQEEVVNRHYSS